MDASPALKGNQSATAVERIFAAVAAALNAVGTLLIVVIISVMNGDIFGRFLFDHPIVGTTEIVQMSIVAILFLQVTYTLRQGALVRSDAFIGAISRSYPRTAALIETIYALIGVFIFFVLARAIWPILIREWVTADEFGTPGVFLYPKWPLRAAMLIGCIAMVIQFLFDLVKSARLAFAGEPRP
jgi:TRAP-type mannitol/chloroaromatic compound transport system permease small subunit